MPILELEDARAALNLQDPNTERDELIEQFCAAVDAVVEQYLGDWVTRRDVTIDAPADGVLPGATVHEVKSGVYLDGTGPVDVAGMRVTGAGILQPAPGRALPPRPWQVTLTVGHTEVPAAIKRGAAEILIQAWATQRRDPAEVPAFLVPYRAAAWLDPYALANLA